VARPDDLPTAILRLEGAVMLSLAVFLYVRGDGGWLLFALLILAPDVGLAGYAAGPRVGAIAYNAVHTTLGPAAVAVIGILGESAGAVSVALVWFAHIGMDRMLGYGLKHTSGFRDTHLGRIGRD
jgi:Domain of unknown function (DUF4260)